MKYNQMITCGLTENITYAAAIISNSRMLKKTIIFRLDTRQCHNHN